MVAIGVITLGAGVLAAIVQPDFLTSIYGKIYDGISRTAGVVFEHFQGIAIILVSVGFALWLVQETYNGMYKTLAMGEAKIDEAYFKKIIKKLFLATAIIGLFLINNPRNIMANTFEIILNFGSGVGRELLQRQMRHNKQAPIQMEMPNGEVVNCGNIPVKLQYESNLDVLSRNTKHEMQCMIREAGALRYEYIELGSYMFIQGLPAIWGAIGTQVAIRLGSTIIGRKFMKAGKAAKVDSKKTINEKLKIGREKRTTIRTNERKINQLRGKTKLTNAERTELARLQSEVKDLNLEVRGLESEIRAARREMNVGQREIETGRRVQDAGAMTANASTAAWFLISDNFKVGLSGILLVGGFFLINMLFGFIIIEQLIFMSMAIIIFPLLIAGFVFEPTKKFATTAIGSTRKYAIGLIFMCFAIVLCGSFNDWIFAGMLGNGNPEVAVQNARIGIELLKDHKMDEFAEFINSQSNMGFYFFFILLAVVINVKILEGATEFAGWFDGQIKQSELGKAMKTFGKGVIALPLSATREAAGAVKDATGDSNISRGLDTASRLTGGIGGGIKRLFGFGKKGGEA